ncbi:MAG: TonB C-terminal domain-containing protein [Pseudomonadota bacterium]
MNSPAEHAPALRGALIVSVLLHVALGCLLLYVKTTPRGIPQRAPIQVFMIAAPSPVTAPAPPPVPVTVPQAVKTPKQLTTALPKAKSATRSTAEPPPPKPSPQTAAAVPKPAAAASGSAKRAPPTPPPEEDFESAEDWVGRVRDLWLAPPDAPERFRCRLKISYGADGSILSVTLLRSCGDYRLDESVKRAAWKSAALKLPRAQQRADVLEVDFVSP